MREDHADYRRLVAAGWREVSNSWGARLHLEADADLAPYRALVEVARDQGYWLRELAPAEFPLLIALETATLPDYPVTVATPVKPVTDRSLAAEAARGGRAFVALWEETVVGATSMHPAQDDSARQCWETERTSVLAAHRRRGLVEGVKALGLLTLIADGIRDFSTGGAGANAASLAANRRLGYQLEPIYRHLAPPEG